MSQNDFAIADQTFPATLADLNSAFQALASMSSAATAPATTYPYQLWADTATDLLKVRNGANNAWLTLAKFDTTNNRWEVRTDILQALTTAGVAVRNSAGTTIATFSNAGVLSGVSITVGAGKVLDISLGTLTLADNQIAGVKVAAATTTTRGTVEQANTTEAETGAVGKFPDAAGVLAAIAANASSGVSFISTADIVSAATVDFTLPAGYDAFSLMLQNVTPDTDAVGLRLLTSANGGVSFDTGATDYKTGLSATPYAFLTSADVGNAAGEEGCSGQVLINGPALAKKTMLSGSVTYLKTDGNGASSNVASIRQSSAAVDAVRILFSSGNIASGTITLYGWKNA